MEKTAMTVVFESSEAMLLVIALREYLAPKKNSDTYPELKDHPTTRAILLNLIDRIDPNHEGDHHEKTSNH